MGMLILFGGGGGAPVPPAAAVLDHNVAFCWLHKITKVVVTQNYYGSWVELQFVNTANCGRCCLF